jgi:hypothetical protein
MSAFHVDAAEILRRNFNALSKRHTHDDRGQIDEAFQRRLAQIFPVGIAMKRAVDVGAGVRHHLDPPDLKLGAVGVVLPRGLATQKVADDGAGQTFESNEAIVNGMAEVDVSPHDRLELLASATRGREQVYQSAAYFSKRSAIWTAFSAAPFRS